LERVSYDVGDCFIEQQTCIIDHLLAHLISERISV